MVDQSITGLRRELHSHAEASMHETETRRILTEFLRANTSLALEDRGAWFYAFKQGSGARPPIAFRADFDAVVCGDGCARHLCGHDGHSSALAGFALYLDRASTDRDVYLIFQPGEEIGAGAVLCSELIPEKHISEVYGFHNIPGYELNTVILPEHTFACASTGLEITLTGRESHAAFPEQGNNPAPVIAELIRYAADAQKKPWRGIVLATVIGIEAGSCYYGVSAGSGTLRLTLRAEYQDEFDRFVSDIEVYARSIAAREGLSCAMKHIEEFPATENEASSVEKVRRAAEKAGIPVVIPEKPFRWSEDFGYYTQKTGGAYFGIGCGKDHPGLHTAEYEFEDAVIETALAVYRNLL